MDNDVASAVEQAKRAGGGRSAAFIEGLAERLGAQAGARVVFGDAVDKAGCTVIPVAKVRYGFGGGAGTKAKGDGAARDEGTGGGGGVMASPLGYIEVRDGQATFKRIVDPMATVAVILASGVTSLLLLRGLRKLMGGRRRRF